MNNYSVIIVNENGEVLSEQTVKAQLDRILNIAQKQLWNTPTATQAIVTSTRHHSLQWTVARY